MRQDLNDRKAWEPVPTSGGYAIRSRAGDWQISRTGAGVHERYSVWRRDPETARCELVCVEMTADDARAVAAGAKDPRWGPRGG